MEQLVRTYQDIYYAEDKINKLIKDGWKVKSINMSHGNYHNGCIRETHIISEKIIVLFDREITTDKKE